RRSERQPPRSVRGCILATAGGHPRNELPVGGVLVHVPTPAAGNVYALGGVLLRVGDEYAAAQRLDAKRRVTLRQLCIAEAGGERDRPERGVEDVDAVVVEVGRVQAVVQGRKASVDGLLRRAIDSRYRSSCVDGGRPAENRSGLRREQEAGSPTYPVLGHHEIACVAVENGTGGA